MTLPEVAAYLKVNRKRVYELVKSRGLPAFRIRSEWRFSILLVDEWLKKMRGSDRDLMSIDDLEAAASVNIGAICYRARCTDVGCKNPGRLLLIYADARGRPISHPVVCHAHARARLARDRVAGLKVYDDREVSRSLPCARPRETGERPRGGTQGLRRSRSLL
jgi:excisionase family DNA binding protein